MHGFWRLPPWPPTGLDAMEEQELLKERIRVLFDRYGIVFREMLKYELPALQWSALSRTLRLMELSGEVIGGSFVAGVQGLQFATPAALRALFAPFPVDEVYWMNATDPASLCGIELDHVRGWLPHRLPTTHLVFHGEKLVLVSRKLGRELTIAAAPDAPRMPHYLSVLATFVSREHNPLKRVRVERINNERATASAYAGALRASGFVSDGSSLSLWKKY